MIKCNMGNVSMSGNRTTLLAETASILKAMRKSLARDSSTEEADEAIDDAVRMSRMSLDELREELGIYIDNEAVEKELAELRELTDRLSKAIRKGSDNE